MSPPITEQARNVVSVATIDEARDLDSQRASSFLDPRMSRAEAERVLNNRDGYCESTLEIACQILDQHPDSLPTSRGSQQSVIKTAAGRGFFST
jgi:hypothetical protein